MGNNVMMILENDTKAKSDFIIVINCESDLKGKIKSDIMIDGYVEINALLHVKDKINACIQDIIENLTQLEN